MHPQSRELLKLHALGSHDRTLVRRHNMDRVNKEKVAIQGLHDIKTHNSQPRDDYIRNGFTFEYTEKILILV